MRVWKCWHKIRVYLEAFGECCYLVCCVYIWVCLVSGWRPPCVFVAATLPVCVSLCQMALQLFWTVQTESLARALILCAVAVSARSSSTMQLCN